MNHIFFIHSNITFLMAKKVIEFQKIPHNKCTFVFDRMLLTSIDYDVRSIKLPFELYPNDYFRVRLDFWHTQKAATELDDFLKDLTKGENFLFYAPKAQSNLFYLTITNTYCSGFFYIEEGYASYNNGGWLNKKKKLLIRDWFYDLCFNKRVPSVKHFYDTTHNKYKGCYALSKFSFEDFSNKSVLELPFQIKAELSDYGPILVFSCELEFGFIKSENYKSSLEHVCEVLIGKKTKRIHYKFHPGQTKEISINLILDVFNQFKDIIEFVKIEQSISLEEIAVSSLKSEFYIINSSIGLYATIAGRKVYSYINFIKEKEPNFQEGLYVPSFYLNNLEFL